MSVMPAEQKVKSVVLLCDEKRLCAATVATVCLS
jgi:hypothetical protein